MDARDSAFISVAFRTLEQRRRSDVLFRGSVACLHVPLSTLHAQPRDCERMTRGQVGSLGLTCTALSSATPRRFIPAHSNTNETRRDVVHDCSRSDQDERLAPPGPERSQRNPEQLVQDSQSTARLLGVQSQVLEDEVPPGMESAAQPAEEMSERHDHGKNSSGKI